MIEEGEELTPVEAVKASSDEVTDKLVEKLSEKFAALIGAKDKKETPVQENCGSKHVKEEADEKDKGDEPPPMEDQEDVKEDSPLTTGAMEKILAQTISKLGLHTEDSRTTKKKREITLKEFKKNLTKEDIFKYMHRAGTQNPQIQEIVYEQAVLASKNNKPVEVLRQVINIMKKNKKS